jgi:hypothetical protein
VGGATYRRGIAAYRHGWQTRDGGDDVKAADWYRPCSVTSTHRQWRRKIKCDAAAGAVPWQPPLAHLIVGIFEKMIESLNANETEPWIFHIGHDVERDRQGSRKEHHVYPAMPCARGHTEPGEQ